MITINNLKKSYKKQVVLNNINLTIQPGTIYGLLGKNGVGKTTLINVMLDLIPVDEGSITLNETNSTALTSKDKLNIGVVLDDLALIEEFNAYDYLKFVGNIYNIPTSELAHRIKGLFSFFYEDLTVLKKSISSYSTGMKKKLAFCAAVIHTPSILILDEPFSGLDPLVANQMLEFIKAYAKDDRVIFLSSHDLSYVEKIATHLGVIDEQELVYNASIKEFTENGIQSLDQALLKVLKPNNVELEKLEWI
jgi:ABC-2 type transport system ATP-binding protein